MRDVGRLAMLKAPQKRRGRSLERYSRTAKHQYLQLTGVLHFLSNDAKKVEKSTKSTKYHRHLDFADGRDTGESGNHLVRRCIVVDFLRPVALEADYKVAAQVRGHRGRGDDLHLACRSYLSGGAYVCVRGSDSDQKTITYQYTDKELVSSSIVCHVCTMCTRSAAFCVPRICVCNKLRLTK